MPSSSRSGGAASPYRDPKVAAATVTPKPPPTAGANDVRAGSFLVAAGGCGDKHKANGTGSSAALRRSKGGGGGDLLLRREQATPGPVASYRCGGCGDKDNGAGSSVAFRRSPLPTFNVQSSLALLVSADIFLNTREPPCMLHRQNKPFPPHRLESCCKERVLTSLICDLHSILHHNKLAI